MLFFLSTMIYHWKPVSIKNEKRDLEKKNKKMNDTKIRKPQIEEFLLFHFIIGDFNTRYFHNTWKYMGYEWNELKSQHKKKG